MRYTYLVDHGDNAPSVGSKLDIQGGTLVAVQFSDALEELEAAKEYIDFLESGIGELRRAKESDEAKRYHALNPRA